jgi:hypothetical protein
VFGKSEGERSQFKNECHINVKVKVKLKVFPLQVWNGS